MGSKTALETVSCSAFDTSPFIYLLEGNGSRGDAAVGLFETLRQADKVTSIVTAIEVLTACQTPDRAERAKMYRLHLSIAKGIRVLAVDWPIAEKAASLRARYSLRTPDAIQVATALTGGAEVFITNDRKLAAISEIEVVIFDDWAKQWHG
jgi:predicted nucleic acid-binding protein